LLNNKSDGVLAMAVAVVKKKLHRLNNSGCDLEHNLESDWPPLECS